MATGDTTYSKKIKGERGNYDWPVKFEKTDGFLGITQFDGEKIKDKVLLSKAQVRALVAFYGK